MSSDHFSPLPAPTLLAWILQDLKENQCLGIDKSLFYIPKPTHPFSFQRYGQLLETPLGVAAGPHTQLAQNIIAAWLVGGRYMELKTIQVLDELNVTKPCIDMTDEGYNCEWSQELKLQESYTEYLNAFVLLHVLKDILGIKGDEAGFIFNMSAGYNLEGIKSPEVQNFFNKMENCQADVEALKQALAPIYPRILELKIPGCISNSLTVSTMHGCPPDEVEKIGRYFIEERKYHTTIKLNPTLLGPEALRGILNKALKFPTEVPDEAFGHDLKYPDGLNIIKNLQLAAEKTGVCFGLKLTNTMETTNEHQNLPKSESMVYMSGRALHPVSINLAAKLQTEFKGELDISFSAGTDCFNIAEILACGLKPVTVCSDLLKPGGYGRLRQYLDQLSTAMSTAKAKSLADFAGSKAKALSTLQTYAQAVKSNPAYAKESFPFEPIKNSRPLPKFDCAAAPCITECPISQDVPRYMAAVLDNDLDKAWQIIMAANPFPHVQGLVCDHKCQSKCTRLNYDAPLQIREIKRFIAENAKPNPAKPKPLTGHKVAIIGAGPSGLTAAHFLALAGSKVTIYESKPFAGGMAADAIPAFRLDTKSLQQDIDAILALGVSLKTNTHVDTALFTQIRAEHDAVYLAIGAQESLALGIPGEEKAGATEATPKAGAPETAVGLMDQLEFLSQLRQGKKPVLGAKTLVIGAGNAAMDVARAAKRLGSEVEIVYRRTKHEMPADLEEIQGALEEGIILRELKAPERVIVQNGKVVGLEVSSMRLEPDPGNRPKPVKIPNSQETIATNSILVAIGQKVVLDFLDQHLVPDPCGSPRTSISNVYLGGDAQTGASSLIKAIAAGRATALEMLTRAGLSLPYISYGRSEVNLEALRQKQAVRSLPVAVPHTPVDKRMNFNLFTQTLSPAAAQVEAGRCLQCDVLCNICSTVCPNRANMAILTPTCNLPLQQAVATENGIQIFTLTIKTLQQPYQIINLADACNECGNCATFCPSAGAPYRDKIRMFLDPAAFAHADSGFHLNASGLHAKIAGTKSLLEPTATGYSYTSDSLQVELEARTLTATKVVFKANQKQAQLDLVVEMAFIYQLLAHRQPFTS